MNNPFKGVKEIPEELPIIPLRDLVVFPNLVIPLFVGREKSIHALEESMKADHLVVLAAQRNPELQEPQLTDLYTVGCVATVMQELKLPDGTAKALVEGLSRVKIVELT
ncbi:MAG: LON peptidase substrate-binding domain-containing protein, partial [Candidatus Subteraquimicrobiales bacterium]|nr:LON peptidase substrate-binding domain-containing protein [Candidatus Subteraquimicrobiales bacterium]